jgi:hypothetical protein
MRSRPEDWTDIWMRWRWITDHLVVRAMLPGLTPGEIKSLKRRERNARQWRRYCFAKAVEEIKAKLAEWEKHEPKKPARPRQLRLPLYCLGSSFPRRMSGRRRSR